ncbi:helix-turn-helix domain-containing protein [Streptomyces sp. NPDC021080]|uniref:helix-turn-helix domain-containing protein n=1 Tax=Streptomyces sp. NPDC021080 TaxID=3365110 RepID=UPI00378F7F77
MVLCARLELDEGERAVVGRPSRARKAPRDVVMRARMIELSWSGLRVLAIAVELGCSQKTVRCWLHRFNRSGLQGLDDLGGQGRRATHHRAGMILDDFPGQNRASGATAVGARRGTVGLR